MNWNPILEAILSHVSKNWEAYSAGAGALALATIICMPVKFPRSLDDWWTWLRNSLQTAIPARHAPASIDPPNPIQPATPAQPPKEKP